MLLKDLSKVYISKNIDIMDHGEANKTWKYKGFAYLNMQQDVNELDRNSTGKVDYSIYKGRTTRKYDINKGDGVSFEDISEAEKIEPEYEVTDINKIGNTFTYIMKKVQKNND